MSKKSNFLGDFSSVNCTCNILDKEQSGYNYIRFMYDRTNQMFEYSGLPDSIPAYMLELYLQLNGHVCITEVNGTLYALPGNLGGAPDPYYRDTLYVVANPGLGYSASLKILNRMSPFGSQDSQGECILVKNDTLMNGLLYLNSRYATQLAENDVSIRSAQINARHQVFISAGTDREVEAANKYLESLEAGKITAVGEQPFLDGIKAANISVQSANTVIQLIELQQYLKASWFNEIGLNANFNMKREYLSEEELQASTDVLLPLIDDMLRCRQEAISLVNETYGTNITVDKNSAWENKQREIDTAHEQAIAEIDSEEGKERAEDGQEEPEEKPKEKEEGDEDATS